MPLITSRHNIIQECGLELTATQCEGYAIALGVPFDGVHDGSGTGESGCIQWYVVVGIGGDGVGGRRGRRRHRVAAGVHRVVVGQGAERRPRVVGDGNALAGRGRVRAGRGPRIQGRSYSNS